MKSYIPLLLIAIILSFASGYYALFIQEEPLASEEDVNRINFLKEKFFRTNRFEDIVNLNEIYNGPGQKSLYLPANILGDHFHRNQAIFSTNKDCFKDLNNLMTTKNLEKAHVWEEFRCGTRDQLTKNFVFDPPFMHPSGISYANLIYLSSNKKRPSLKALTKILPYFHISELPALQKSLGRLPVPYSYLADLNDEGMMYLLSGSKVILSRNFLLQNNSNFFNFFENVFRVYDREKFERYLEKTNYQVKINNTSKTCFFRDGGVCWEYNLRTMFLLTNKTKLLVLGMSLIILIMVMWQIVLKLRLQKRDDDKRRLALQVLTHEFRTPITSLLLSLENINKNFSEISENVQEDFLRMSSDIYRLQRLTEMSQNYLKSDNKKELVGINKIKVESINQLVEIIVEPYVEKVEVSYLKNDRSCELDEYWLSICLKNLIENALFHGATPVKVEIEYEKDRLIINVVDAGNCTFDSIEDLTKPFIKGNKSSGIGLGLNIVKNVVEAMGGNLNFKKGPTTFSISLKGVA